MAIVLYFLKVKKTFTTVCSLYKSKPKNMKFTFNLSHENGFSFFDVKDLSTACFSQFTFSRIFTKFAIQDKI